VGSLSDTADIQLKLDFRPNALTVASGRKKKKRERDRK
jgi:hypothetical protein